MQLAFRSASTELAQTAHMKFCVDLDLVQCLISLGFTNGAFGEEALNDKMVRSLLEKRSTESNEAVTLEKLGNKVS